MIDLSAELAEAMRTPEVRSALVALVAPIIADFLKALESREETCYLDSKQLAQRLGITRRALSQRLHRGSQLAAIAQWLDGKRVWRRQDVEALLTSRPRLGPRGQGTGG